MVVFHDEEQNKKLAEIHAQQEEAVVKSISADYGIGYIDLSGVGINADALLLIPEAVSRDAQVAVFGMVGKKINIAVISPVDPKTIEQIDNLETKGFVVHLFLVSKRSMDKALARYADVSGALHARAGLLDINDAELQRLAESVHTNTDIREQFLEMVNSGETHKISKLMEIIFGTAIGTKSSDVHIEAAEEFARLRFRQDGVLQDIAEFPLDIYKSINARIKLLSELKLTNTAIAQDGRFTIMYKGTQIEIRTSLIPGPYGESIVLRILNPEGLAVDFEKLGFPLQLIPILEKEIKKPNGMIITTGPTGSGKTTTLYSILKKVYTPEIKILTIEDPIEYHLPGITQTQVEHDKGYDFSSGLRAALRQDPDVIMVGEIRDKETATTAINASLTGHLVLSTLHTNNAAGAIPRLIELGVNPKILPDALTVAMAQRMIRRLCQHCKQVQTIPEKDEQLLRAIIKNAEQSGKDFASLGISSNGPLTVYQAVGCEACGNIGYKGRVGLFEAILIDDALADVIATNPTERQIKHSANRQGIFTMTEDGVAKILSGITSIEEVQGTVDLVEDLPPDWYKDFASPEIPEQKSFKKIQDIDLSEQSLSRLSRDYGDNQQIDTATRETAIPDLKNFYQNSYTSPDERAHQLMDDFLVQPYAVNDHEYKKSVQELEVLVDYLRLLEQEQLRDPETGIRVRIAEVKEMIIELMRTHNITDWVTPMRRATVHDEVKQLINDLQKLEDHQSRRPNIGVAQQLRDIRNTIENLIVKE